jgi:hypothetical protein
MHPDELHRRIGELVDDNAVRATPPPVAAIRRRGRVRRARVASGVVLLVVVVAGLFALYRPLGEVVGPTPPVMQPPRSPARPAQPAPKSFADFAMRIMTGSSVRRVVLLDQGENSTWLWQIGAASAVHAGRPQICVLSKAEPSAQARSAASRSMTRSTVVEIREGAEGLSCTRDQDAGPKLAPDYVDGDDGTQPAFGMAPSETVRVRLLLHRRPPVEVDAIDGGSAFQHRFWVVAHPGARIVGGVALDAGGRELARYP